MRHLQDLLRLLQLFCEGHHEDLQNYVRHQEGPRRPPLRRHMAHRQPLPHPSPGFLQTFLPGLPREGRPEVIAGGIRLTDRGWRLTDGG